MALVYATAEEIGASLVLALKPGIVGNNALQRVDRQHAEDFNNAEYPSAFVNDVRREITRVLKDVVRVVHSFDIVVFNRSEEGDLATKINSLINDTSEALINDPTRGGIAYNTRIIRVVTDGGAYEPIYVAAFEVEVYYLARK